MITNKLNLPNSFVNYVSKESHSPVKNRYSVTELLKPTREIVLTRLYEFNEDVSDYIPALFGTAVHKILEENTTEGKAELKLEVPFNQYTIVGKIDLLNNDEIIDYKTCSTSKILKEDFDDWKMQGLLYAYLIYLKNGTRIKRLKFYALLKDYSKLKHQDLKPIYVYEYNIADSDIIYIEEWLNKKLIEIENGFKELPECTDKEKWFTGNKYAIYKNSGDKRAYKVCDSEQEAHETIAKIGGAGEIEVRLGENVKCMNYCKCYDYCKGGKEWNYRKR
jgi:hypothetical protein